MEPLSSPNEAINLDLSLMFVAIPMTGGTAIRKQVAGPGPHLLRARNLDIVQLQDLLYFWELRQALGRNDRFPSHDVPTDSDVRRTAERAFAQLFKFTIVRNPWARAVALYFRQDGVRASEQMSFEAFCDRHLHASDTCSHPTRHATQADWLTGRDGTLLVDCVVRVEDLAAGLAEVARLTDGRVSLDPDVAGSGDPAATGYRDFYRGRTRDLIAERFNEDIERFGYRF